MLNLPLYNREGTLEKSSVAQDFPIGKGCIFVSARFCAIVIFFPWMEHRSIYLPVFPAQEHHVRHRIIFRRDCKG
ncbi:hypothetical protein NC651_028673 [Populus alba x Populus x berolinensis]|nr:hypothetical protein NC651_028673 [Populus alba x Populus x berolinensis]